MPPDSPQPCWRSPRERPASVEAAIEILRDPPGEDVAQREIDLCRQQEGDRIGYQCRPAMQGQQPEQQQLERPGSGSGEGEATWPAESAWQQGAHRPPGICPAVCGGKESHGVYRPFDGYHVAVLQRTVPS